MSKRKELTLRIISSLVLIPFVILILLAGKWPTLIVSVLVGVLAWVEWFRLCQKAPTSSHSFIFLFIGNAYIFFGCALIWVLTAKLSGQAVLALLSLVFASDIGAYVFGNILRGPKLAPKISPNKTWSGSIGGFVGTYLVGTLLVQQTILDTTSLPFLSAPWFLIGVSLMAQLGDFSESWAKRILNAKDSGTIIPGHGGILDRLDSVLPVLYFTGVCALIFSRI